MQPDRNLQQLGANIRKERERCGMSQQHVAVDLECFAKPSLSEWERGKSEPGATKIHALAACFGVPVERFFEGVE